MANHTFDWLALQDALSFYLDKHLCCIPVPWGEKKYDFYHAGNQGWEKFQKEQPSREQIAKWFRPDKPTNISIVCGGVSNGLVVIDFNTSTGAMDFFGQELWAQLLTTTFIVKTSRGHQVFLRLDKKFKSTYGYKPDSPIHPKPFMEIKSDGTYVVVPPSLHPDGPLYENIGVNEIATPKNFEAGIKKRADALGINLKLRSASKDTTPKELGKAEEKAHALCIANMLWGVNKSQRDEAAFAIAGQYIDDLGYPPEDVLGLLKIWDKKNKPPFNDDHLLETKVELASKSEKPFNCDLIQNSTALATFCVGDEKCDWPKPKKLGKEPLIQKEKPEKNKERLKKVYELAVTKLLDNCAFIQHCRDDAVSLSEPEWYAMITNLATLKEPGEKKAHELSSPYGKYTEEETDAKIKYAKEAVGDEKSPQTCEHIEQTLGFKCPKNCLAKEYGRKAPAGLAKVLASVEIPLKEGRTNQTQRLIELAHSEDIYLFKDQYNEPCARVSISEHFENWRLRSRDFKRYLGRLLYQKKGEAPSTEAIKNAILTLEAEALFDNPSNIHTLSNRVARVDDAFFYDLTDPTWRAVKITSSGWEIVDKPPILFRRYKQQMPQVEPIKGGDPWLIFKVARVPEEQQLLLLVWAISCLIPNIPHAIPIITGSEGSAKTFACHILRDVIDPSTLKTLSLGRKDEEIVQRLDHNWCALFDNISYLPDWQIDYLCKAVTGDGMSKRELFSDDEDIIFTFKRCVGLNAIDLAVDRPDFLDRAILFPLGGSIPDTERREEGELEEEFNKLKPAIFGGFLDVLSKAMANKPGVKLEAKPRMADFATWGCAITEALKDQAGKPFTRKAFLISYNDNIKARHSEILAQSTIGTLLVEFMLNKDEWTGTPTELLGLLTSEAEAMGVDVKAKGFPKTANYLSKDLMLLKVNLAKNGIIVEKAVNVGTRHLRGFKITKGESIFQPKAQIDATIDAT